MKPLETIWQGAVLRVTLEKGYTYVTYAGQRRLLSAWSTSVRNKALSLISGAK